jgi:predicted nucleic-acid-binding protein
VIAVDTNVLVRLLTGDDAAQFKASEKLFASATLFIPDTVLLEAEWVLRAAYDLKPADVCAGFRRLLGLANVNVADGQRVARAIGWHEDGLDFADALHLAHCQSHEAMKTFDANFIKRARTRGECRVEKP